MSARTWSGVFALLAALSSGCGGAGSGPASAPPAAPAKVQNGGVKEADWPPSHSRRRRSSASASRLPRWRSPSGPTAQLRGRGISPPGKIADGRKPGGGHPPRGERSAAPGAQVTRGQVLFRVVPMVAAQRDLRLTAESELTAAKARLEAARRRQARAEQMLRDQVGSVRADEEARNETTQAQVAFDAARPGSSESRSLRWTPMPAWWSRPGRRNAASAPRRAGQKVAAGSPLFSLADYSRLWLRVPVYAGDLVELDPRAPAQVGKIGERPGRCVPHRPWAPRPPPTRLRTPWTVTMNCPAAHPIRARRCTFRSSSAARTRRSRFHGQRSSMTIGAAPGCTRSSRPTSL